MHAAVVTAFGRPPAFQATDDPAPTGDLVAVPVVAASVKNLDRGLVSGTHYGSKALSLPFVPGVDGVVTLPDGRHAYTNAVGTQGLMAEQTLVDPARAVAIPAGVDPALAAALPNPGMSGWFALEHGAALQPGQTLLVLGATGVTGAVATQLAKQRFGAGRVVVAGRNPQRLERLRDRGADAVLPIGDDLAEQVRTLHAATPFDAVLDYLWGTPAEQVLTALGNESLSAGYHRTRFVQVGSMAGPTIALPANVMRSAGVEIVGTGFGSVPPAVTSRIGSEILPELFAMASAGTVTVDVSVRPLADVEGVWSNPDPAGTRTVLVP
jgi:NADPH:quinone reductase-like Zn-dependent oxidoreductase